MLDRYDQDLLLDYLEDELDATRRAQLDELLAQDPQLAALLTEMVKDRQALRSLPHADAPKDLIQDVTQTLERRMLLDDSVDDDGPIPLSRGRGLTGEPTRSISWGRVVGLTGLAASVALAAGIVVITLDDPLERTANQLAASPEPEAVEEIQRDESDAVPQAESRIAEQSPSPAADSDSLSSARSQAATQGPLDAKDLAAKENRVDEALALGRTTPETFADSTPIPDATADDAGLARGANDGRADPLARRSAAALTAIQPRQQLVLLTDEPERSRDLLFEFCVANGIPIVQPEQPLDDPLLPREQSDNRPAQRDIVQAPQDDPVLAQGYALLIDERQLEVLVHRLNHDVSIEPKHAGKALFANQAAVLSDLPTAARYERERGDLFFLRDAQLEGLADAAPQSSKPDDVAGQQAIQLNLPTDLGSDYANSRNAYNLNIKQQQSDYRSIRDEPTTAALSDPPLPQPESAPQPAIAPQAGLEKLQAEAEPQETAPVDGAPGDDATARDLGAFDAKQDQPDAGNKLTTAPAINPVRGNWLAAHLPYADTTPLLVQWRSGTAAGQTKLIPITIQRAAPDKVNTLRQRQQVEQANRQQRDNNAEPTDAEPTKPEE